MQPKITPPIQLSLVGLSFYGDPFQLSGAWTEENEIGRLWQRFLDLQAQQPEIFPPARREGVMFELHVLHPSTPERGEHEVFVGIEVEAAGAASPLLSFKILPESVYAIFTLVGRQIISDWGREMMETWLPECGYVYVGGYSLQRYDQRFKGMDRIDQSKLDVWVPVCPR